MSFVFISYSRRDQEKVDRLAAHLTSRNIPYWIDRQGIYGGDEWRRQIVEGIQNCAVFLLILSGSSVASRNVRKEIDLAEHYGKRIIPVEFENVEIPDQLEYQLVGIQRIDLTGNMSVMMGPLDMILEPYRQPVPRNTLNVVAKPKVPVTSPIHQGGKAVGSIEPTEALWKRMSAIGGMHFLASLLYLWLYSLIEPIEFGVALFLIAVLLVPGLIAGYILPNVRGNLSGFLIILGSMLGVLVLGIVIAGISKDWIGVGNFFLFISLLIPYNSIPYARRKSGSPPTWRRVAGVAGIYGLAGLVFAVAWFILLVLVSLIRGGQFEFRVTEFMVPDYLSFLLGRDFRDGIRLQELAVIYPLSWLVPGWIAGILLPAIKPYVKILGIWLGMIVVVGLLGELVYFTIGIMLLANNGFPSYMWRDWFNVIILVGGPLSTLFYAWNIYRKRIDR